MVTDSTIGDQYLRIPETSQNIDTNQIFLQSLLYVSNYCLQIEKGSTVLSFNSNIPSSSIRP